MADEVAGEDWVEMRHPDVEGTARVTKEALDTVWSEKGWVLASPVAPAASPLPAAPTEEGH